MISVLIVTHGGLGQELLACAETIVGKQALVRVLGLDMTEGPDSFEKRVRAALEEMNSPAGVIVLADMMGGTPCNTVLRQCRDPRWNFELVTGINLPMMVSVLSKRSQMPLEKLAQKIVDDGPRTLVRPLPKLRDSLRQSGQ
jgi:PTS system mannose-specific IIA component